MRATINPEMTAERVTADAWSAALLRVTYISETPEISPSEGSNAWCVAAMSSEPESSVAKNKRGTVEHSGEALGGQMILKTDVGRIDWLLGPSQNPSTEIPIEFPNV